MVLEGPHAATHAKVTEGSGERPGSRDIDRFFPAQAEPVEEVHGADHALRASATSAGGSLLRQPIRPLHARREARRKASLAPEDQVNHLPNVAPAPPKGGASGRLTDPSSNL